MRTARSVLLAVLIAILLSLCSTANAQHNPYGPPSDQVYFVAPNINILNYSSNTVNEPPLWNFFDLGAGAPIPATNSPLTSFSYGTEDLVYYIGTDNHVHEDQWDTSKGTSYLDITNASGAPLPAAGSALTSILDGEHGYIYYVGSDMHAHQITWASGGTWASTDITATAGAADVGYAGSMASFIFGGDLEVVYETAANHIIQVYLNSGSTWKTLDMTALSGAPRAVNATGLTGFKYPGGHAHVYYFSEPGSSVSLGELYSDSGTWFYDNLSPGAGIPTPQNYTSLTSLSFGSSIRVYYEKYDGNGYSDIIEFHAANEGPGFGNGNGWGYQDLDSVPASLYPPNANSPLASYVNTHTSPQTVRLLYVADPVVVGSTMYQGQPYVVVAYGYTSSGLDLTWNWSGVAEWEPTQVTGTFW